MNTAIASIGVNLQPKILLSVKTILPKSKKKKVHASAICGWMLNQQGRRHYFVRELRLDTQLQYSCRPLQLGEFFPTLLNKFIFSLHIRL